MGMNSFNGIKSILTLVISVSLLFQKTICIQEGETEEVNSFSFFFFWMLVFFIRIALARQKNS